MSFNITIPTDILKAAAICASHDQHRYYINGVFVDPHGYLVSTDGHRLFCAQIDLDTAHPVGTIIPNDAIKKALTGFKDVTITLTPNRLGDTLYTPVDGTFPDWRRVVPTEVDGVTAQFNPAYLADFGKVAKILGDKKGAPRIWHNGDSPAGIEFTREDCFGVLMPMRVTGNGAGWGAYVNRVLGA